MGGWRKSVITMALFAGGQASLASGCSSDPAPSESSGAGTSSNDGGTGAGTGGKGSAGKGGNAQAGKGAGGTKNYVGTDGDGGEGGDSAQPVAGSGGGGKGGAGGMAGAGAVAGNAGFSGGGAGGMSGGGAGGTAGSSAGMGGTTGGGGTGGTAGGGSSATPCGNGVVDEGEACDPKDGKYTQDDCGAVWGTGSGETGASSACQLITPLVCAMCEAQSDCAQLTDSSQLMGKTATAGPAMGVKRAVLYNETMDCIRDTQCAIGLPIDCYCGTVSSAQCDAGNGNGKCRSVIERGLETTDPAEVQLRYLSLTYGASLALARINCDQQNCLEACFPAAP